MGDVGAESSWQSNSEHGAVKRYLGSRCYSVKQLLLKMATPFSFRFLGQVLTLAVE